MSPKPTTVSVYRGPENLRLLRIGKPAFSPATVSYGMFAIGIASFALMAVTVRQELSMRPAARSADALVASSPSMQVAEKAHANEGGFQPRSAVDESKETHFVKAQDQRSTVANTNMAFAKNP